MEKRKVFKISIIDKEISRTEFDRNTFYTSDSELALVFKLIEKDYSYDHGEILLYNENDKSFVTRKIMKKENDFVYEIDSDIIPHYGKWKAQLQLVNDGDIYTSKPFEFSIVNDISNLAPQPTLTDINNWSTLKESVNELIDEMQDIIVDVKKSESERNIKENGRQQAELERINKENGRQQAELERINKENGRQQDELERVNKENTRQQNELERIRKESSRQKDESERISKENTRQQAESGRQSAELIRVENENKRNLTSVDEFIKLQDSIGGRNLIINSNFEDGIRSWGSVYANLSTDNDILKIVSTGVTPDFTRLEKNVNNLKSGTYTVTAKVRSSTRVAFKTFVNANVENVMYIDTENDWTIISNKVTVLNDDVDVIIRLYLENAVKGVTTEIDWMKLEKGTQTTPYTKAPEDYRLVSKDDYYNHVKLINEFKNNQFNELKKTVIALGGTI